MYINLRAEMTRHNISAQDIAALLGKTTRSVRDKIAGRSDFTIGEFTKIQTAFFPALSLDYLAEKNPASDTPPVDQKGA